MIEELKQQAARISRLTGQDVTVQWCGEECRQQWEENRWMVSSYVVKVNGIQVGYSMSPLETGAMLDGMEAITSVVGRGNHNG
jgi:hypothetical protein